MDSSAPDERSDGVAGNRPYSAAQRRDIRLVALLRGLSFLGDNIALIALYLRVAPLGHAWAIAALAIAGSLPLVLLAPVAGHVVDRVPAKRLLVQLGVVEAVVCGALGYWHGLGATLVLMFTLSCAVAFSLPGYGALIPSIAGDENVARAQVMMQSVQAVASVVGPALGGLLVGWAGQSWPLYLDAISFALAAVATAFVRHDRRPSPETNLQSSESKKMMAGVSFITHDDLLRPLILASFVFMLALGMVNVAEVFFITQTLHASATFYGLIGTSFGVGMIGGSLLGGRLSQDLTKLARSLTICLVLVGVAIGAVGLVTYVDYIYPLMVLAGVAVGIVNVAAMTLFTLRTPEALRGRMFAAVGAVFTSAEIGSMAAGGAILVVVAPRTVFQIAGIASTFSALTLGPLALRASVRSHRRESAH